MMKGLRVVAALAASFVTSPLLAQQAPAPAPAAQTPAGNVTICGSQVGPPSSQPPAGSPPVVYLIAPCWEKQGNQTLIEPATYLYYIQLKPSSPMQGTWVPFDETAEKTILEDFRRLWNTNFLDDLSVQISDPPGTPGSTFTDYVFPNGVHGKLVVYQMEERQRVKIVDYTGSKQLETAKIEEKLKEVDVAIRLDSFIDAGLLRRVSGIVVDMMKEKGFQAATVTPEIVEMPGGPKLVHVSFHIDEGPKIKIRHIDFVGNKAFTDGKLKRRMKENKERIIWARMFAGRSTYQEAKFDEDADKVVEYYRDRGYITARVGQPELTAVSDSDDKKTRQVDIKVPITEGNLYHVGEFCFDGNTGVKAEDLRPMFKTAPG